MRISNITTILIGIMSRYIKLIQYFAKVIYDMNSCQRLVSPPLRYVQYNSLFGPFINIALMCSAENWAVLQKMLPQWANEVY